MLLLVLAHSETKRSPWPLLNGNDELPAVYCSCRGWKLKVRDMIGNPKRSIYVLGSRGEFCGNVITYQTFKTFFTIDYANTLCITMFF